MIEEIKNIKSQKKDLRKFGVTVGGILLIIAGILFWKEKESFRIFFIIGITLIVSGLAIPFILKPIYLVWMTFAAILGWIMTRVILCVIFYTVITPISLISRIFGKKFLELRWNRSKKTYWNYRSDDKKNDCTKQF